MSPATSFVMCAVFFFAVCRCDSFSKADESELKRDPKVVGIEDTGAEWDVKGNLQDINELHEAETNEHGQEQDMSNILGAKERRLFRPKCRGRPYNPSFYMCCNGYLVRRTGLRPACCGRYPYDTTFYQCCGGNRVRKTGLRPACCGRYSYDATFYLCCSGNRVRKTGLRPACCGRYSYDATFYQCCGGNRVRKTGLRPACCRRYSYDATFYLCCNGRLKRKSGFRPSC